MVIAASVWQASSKEQASKQARRQEASRQAGGKQTSRQGSEVRKYERKEARRQAGKRTAVLIPPSRVRDHLYQPADGLDVVIVSRSLGAVGGCTIALAHDA